MYIYIYIYLCVCLCVLISIYLHLQVAAWKLQSTYLVTPGSIHIIPTFVQRFLSPCTPPCRLPQKDLSHSKQPSRQRIPHPSQHDIRSKSDEISRTQRGKCETTRNAKVIWDDSFKGGCKARPHGFRLGLFQWVHMIWEAPPERVM